MFELTIFLKIYSNNIHKEIEENIPGQPISGSRKHVSQSLTNTFLRPNMNTKYYSVFRNNQIPNNEYYSGVKQFKYGIPIIVMGLTI